jgi:hypothetical protein
MTPVQTAIEFPTLADAESWKRDNPAAYTQAVEWAFEDYRQGIRPSIDLIANLLRRPHFAAKLGLKRSDAVYRVNNNLRSKLARLMAAEYPDTLGDKRRGFETRGAA